jgi:hypothetical protein
MGKKARQLGDESRREWRWENVRRTEEVIDNPSTQRIGLKHRRVPGKDTILRPGENREKKRQEWAKTSQCRRKKEYHKTSPKIQEYTERWKYWDPRREYEADR